MATGCSHWLRYGVGSPASQQQSAANRVNVDLLHPSSRVMCMAHDNGSLLTPGYSHQDDASLGRHCRAKADSAVKEQVATGEASMDAAPLSRAGHFDQNVSLRLDLERFAHPAMLRLQLALFAVPSKGGCDDWTCFGVVLIGVSSWCFCH
eukprot:2482998-Amphidinium_carterae.2